MNPFYKNHQQQVQQNLQTALQQVACRLPVGMSAEQFVRQKIQNGEMTQQRFEQYAQIANMITGRK